MRTVPAYPLVVNQSMGANYTSPAFKLDQVMMFSIEATWTGTPTGNISLQASNDGVNYYQISGTSQATGGAAGGFLWNVSNAGYLYVQLYYAFTSGTGTLNATGTSKGF